MRLLLLTFLFGMLNVFSSGPTLEYRPAFPIKIAKSLKVSPTPINVIDPVVTGIILQSRDGGQTWEDISEGLPENELPEDFFSGESDLYVRVKHIMYHSKGNLKTPVWERENVLDPRYDSAIFSRSGVMDMLETRGALIAISQKGIIRSTDNGEHWKSVISEGGVGIAIERIEGGGIAAISYSVKAQCRRIRISWDGGETWSAIDEGLPPSASISSIKQMGPYLICGHPDGIFQSSDMGKTWKKVHESADKSIFKYGDTWDAEGSSNPGKVYKLYASGDVLYAVARNAGC